MKVALVGYGIENQSALRYWQAKGAEVTVCDQDLSVEVPAGVDTHLGPAYLDGLDEFDVVVRTSGMHPDIILDKNPGLEAKLTTAVNLFFGDCRTPIIGITGTKGKGTTSTLITKILEAAGKKVILAGNIGVPMLDLLPQTTEADYVVLELSSFQLIDCKFSPQIGVCLMVVPEHMNWHRDMDDYSEAKQRLFQYQTSEDLAVFNRANAISEQIASVSMGRKLSYEVPKLGAEPSSREGAYVMRDTVYMNEAPVCSTADIALLGRHNWENVCAAIAATWEIIDGDTAAIKSVVSSFTGLEHRLELVREFEGVKYYDDSFGTTPETAMVAIQAFGQPKVVILGGSDKGAEFDDLAQIVKMSNVKQVVLIGNTAHPVYKSAAAELESSLRAAGFENINSLVKAGYTSMPEIVHATRTAARPGDVVLLSTGCASFDLFDNYKDRGDQFKQSVLALA